MHLLTILCAGGKGCGLGEMKKIGLPVPPGFTIVTSACVFYSKHRSHPAGLDDAVRAAVVRLEKDTGKLFGKQGKNGMLLLSVRSGAAFSMPGMVSNLLRNISKTHGLTFRDENRWTQCLTWD